MSFISNPKQLTLPEDAFYPVDRLCFFDRDNRLSWEQAFGGQGQKWDKERRAAGRSGSPLSIPQEPLSSR